MNLPFFRVCTPSNIKMEPQKLVVWVDVSPFPFGGHFQVPAGFRGSIDVQVDLVGGFNPSEKY